MDTYATEAAPTPAKTSEAHWLDRAVAGSAMLIAVISLVVAVRQSNIMERQLAASVWPYLQYDTSNATADGHRVMSFGVENVGIGPAQVHSVSMRYGDQTIRGVADLLKACCSDLLAQNARPVWRISTLHDEVLAPNRPKTFLLLTDEPSNTAFLQRLDMQRQKIAVRFCYCSVLDECWMFDSDKDNRVPLAACPAPGPDDYSG